MQLDVRTTAHRTIIDYRDQGYGDLCVLGRYRYNKVEKEVATHVHKDMIEICYCDKGSQLFDVEGKKHFVKGGEVFIHYPGEKHSSGGMPEEKGCLYWIIIRTKTLKKAKKLCPHLAELIASLVQKNIRHFKASKDTKKNLEAIFDHHANGTSNVLYDIRSQVLINTLLLKLLDATNSDGTEIHDERLATIIDYISHHLKENLTIDELAKKINLSPSRFKNWFKEATGFTPIDYIQRQRIHVAIGILSQDKDMPLGQLAYDYNFSSPQYFSTVVKKYTGKSPSHIRGI